MVADERNEKFVATVLKDESKIAIAAAFKKLVPQFADAETAVGMRLTIAFDEIAEGQKTFYPFALGKLAESAENRRIDRKKLTQASL